MWTLNQKYILLNCRLGNNFDSSLCRNSSSFIFQKICLQIEGECWYVKSQLTICAQYKFSLHKLVLMWPRCPTDVYQSPYFLCNWVPFYIVPFFLTGKERFLINYEGQWIMVVGNVSLHVLVPFLCAECFYGLLIRWYWICEAFCLVRLELLFKYNKVISASSQRVVVAVHK